MNGITVLMQSQQINCMIMGIGWKSDKLGPAPVGTHKATIDAHGKWGGWVKGIL